MFIKGKKESEICGGTDRSFDKNAPKEILSKDMILFDVKSVLPQRENIDFKRDKPITFVSAFAAPAGDGTFLLLETRNNFYHRGESNRLTAYVKDDLFPSLVSLTRELDLASDNGIHSFTHGLPENFGGSIRIEYASGEKISISCNQSPVLSVKQGEIIASVFNEAIKGEKVVLPDIGELKEIRFSEERKDGGFTRAQLSIKDDGSGKLIRSSRYFDPTVYNAEKDLGKNEIDSIKLIISYFCVLAWSKLPENSYPFGDEKFLTFIFKDGTEITVPKDREVPDQIRDGFFKIELELTK